MEKVSALFVRNDSIYKQLGIDSWDIERDARNWPGGNPIIAHPPCRAWGRLRKFAKPGPDEYLLAVFAVHNIQMYGGVLEHPATSTLWSFMNLPLPGAGPDRLGGYSISVNQFDFGHPAEKKTWLYIVGIPKANLPPIPISFDCVMYVINSSKKKKHGRIKKEVSKKWREATPVTFAKWLIDVACKCKMSSIKPKP